MPSPLKSSRLRRILVAYTVNRLGSWVGLVALSLAVFDHTHSALAVAALLFLAAGIGSARADVIDGEWCDDMGHHFTISGPEIVTPEGTRTTGHYSRHAFSYADPLSSAPDGTRRTSVTPTSASSVAIWREIAGWV